MRQVKELAQQAVVAVPDCWVQGPLAKALPHPVEDKSTVGTRAAAVWASSVSSAVSCEVTVTHLRLVSMDIVDSATEFAMHLVVVSMHVQETVVSGLGEHILVV